MFARNRGPMHLNGIILFILHLLFARHWFDCRLNKSYVDSVVYVTLYVKVRLCYTSSFVICANHLVQQYQICRTSVILQLRSDKLLRLRSVLADELPQFVILFAAFWEQLVKRRP